MLRIYGVHRSRAARNYWLLNELGVPYEAVPVIQAYRLADPGAAGAPANTRSPDFLALSPAGAIPVMDDDGFVLSESLAINLYLATKHGGPLAPADAREAAAMAQWALYGTASIEPHALAILSTIGGGRGETAEGRAAVEAAVAALERPLAVLDAHLAAEGSMVGRRFTVADINMAEILRYAQPHPSLLGRYRAIGAWLGECQSRPAFRAMWERRLAEPE